MNTHPRRHERWPRGAIWLIAALALSCTQEPPAPAPEPASSAPPQRTTPAPIPQARPLPSGVQRGMCLAHAWDHRGVRGYGSAASEVSKAELIELGVDWVSLTVFGHQPTLESREVTFDPFTLDGESDARLTAEVGQLRALDLSVMLKPHMHIKPHLWRGHIDPLGRDGWAAWFESYGRFIVHYAALAERLGVEAYVVGLELYSSAWYERGHWVELIERVREVYTGKVVYAANWNEAERVVFWDKVDWIGVQFFPPLSKNDHPTYKELRDAIAPHLDTYQALHETYGKPVVLTEFGYKSIRNTADEPNAWPRHLSPAARAYDEHNQALAYTALLDAAGERPFINGVYVWKWFTDLEHDPEGRLGFSPRHKKAARVLERAFASPKPSTPRSGPGDPSPP